MTGTAHRPTILLADDDPFIAALYKGKLTQAGVGVEVARDGEEALRRLHESLPSLLVLDLNMPRVSGVEVLRFIREASPRPDLPVIVLSNACTQDMLESVQALRPTLFLTKRETAPNRVIDEILARIRSEASAGDPVPRLSMGASPEVGADLRGCAVAIEALGQAADDSARREALLDLYRQIQADLERIRRAAPLSVAHQAGKSAEALFEDLYARPSAVHPATLCSLQELVARLPAWCAEAESGYGIAHPEPVVIYSEDAAMRESLREMLDRPGLLPVAIRRESSVIDLMEANPLGLLIWDAAKASAVRTAWRKIRESAANRSAGLLFLLPAERWPRDGHDGEDGRAVVLAKPVLPPELRLRVYALRSAAGPAPSEAGAPA